MKQVSHHLRIICTFFADSIDCRDDTAFSLCTKGSDNLISTPIGLKSTDTFLVLSLCLFPTCCGGGGTCWSFLLPTKKVSVCCVSSLDRSVHKECVFFVAGGRC